MSVEENKTIVRRFFECFNAGTLDVWNEICAADLVTHQSLQPDIIGLETRKRGETVVRAAFSDLNIVVEDLIAEGDKVVARFVSSGTHQGEWLGIPSTGKQASMAAIAIFRLAEGKIVEEWLNADLFGLLGQLDIIPPWEELVERAKNKQA